MSVPDYIEMGRELEVQELRKMAADWQHQFHALKSQCEGYGFTVGYGENGMPVLASPKQQLPGEDPPFEQCQCSACVALREQA